LHHVLAEEQKIDADIMSSMLTAVNDFVADSFGTDGYLGLLQYGEHTVMIEKGTNCYIVAVMLGDGNDELRDTIAKQVNLIETTKKSELKNWGGDISIFDSCNSNLIKILLQSTARNKSEVSD
jgi:hypothetical protein